MAVWHVLFAAAVLNLGPAAEIDTLKGERPAGELVSFDATAAVVKSGESSLTIPLADVLEVRFPAAPPPEPSSGARIVLIDGTRLTLSAFSVAGDQARCETSFASFSIP